MAELSNETPNEVTTDQVYFGTGIDNKKAAQLPKCVAQANVENPSVAHPLLNKVKQEELGQIGTNGKAYNSKWTVGWWTPFLLVGPYLAAIILAVIHLLFFNYLDGKRSSDGFSPLPQSYITTISTILVTSFGTILKLGLATAFTQYLWHILRQSAHRVDTVETLFGMKGNPFLVARHSVLGTTPILCILVVFSVGFKVAISFAPGALTIKSQEFTNQTTVEVPWFNASSSAYNGPAETSIRSPRLAISTFRSSTGIYIGPMHSLRRIATSSFTSGAILDTPLQCGLNCSYTTTFQGPYIVCDPLKSSNVSRKFSKEQYLNNQAGVNIMFSAKHDKVPSQDPYYTESQLNIYTSRIVGFWPKRSPQSNALGADNFIWETHNLTCRPHRAEYTVNFAWRDGVREITRTEKVLDALVNLGPNSLNYIETKDFLAYHRQWIHDSNLQALFETLVGVIEGNYTILVMPSKREASEQPFNETFQFENGTGIELDPPFLTTQGFSYSNPGDVYGANLTLAAQSHLNANFLKFPESGGQDIPEFTISAALLNDALFNLTMSSTFAIYLGSKSALETETTFHNIFVFSRKLQFFLPYFLSLALALPFIILGFLALGWNGVSATEGGFLQILCTTTASWRLREIAGGGCLGGGENVPEDIKGVRIRFGVVGSEGRGVAGFGISDEVEPLLKKRGYGGRW